MEKKSLIILQSDLNNHIDIANQILSVISSQATSLGRFEIIDNDPVKILDGAHNISGFETLFQNLEHLYKDIDFDCYLGLKEGKKYEKILDFLSQIENISINIIEDNSFYNQMSSKYLQSYLEERNINFEISSIEKFHLSKQHSILIGSLYLIGEYKKEFK